MPVKKRARVVTTEWISQGRTVLVHQDRFLRLISLCHN